MTGALSIRLMILSGPPQRRQIRGSASYTFLMSRAQERLSRRAKSSAQPGCCALDSGASASLAGAEPARCAPKPGKTTAEVPALKILFDHMPDDGAPEAVLFFVAVIPNAHELVEVVLDQVI